MKKIKKMLLLTLMVALILSLTGCGKEEKAIADNLDFEVDAPSMQKLSQMIIDQYKDVNDTAKEYYLSDGNDLQKTAVRGFDAAQTTDHVGRFDKYLEGEGSFKIRNGAEGKVVFSQFCKYEHRTVEVKVAYSENKGYALDKERLYSDLSKQAADYNMDITQYIPAAYGEDEELDMTSMDGFLDSYLGKYYGVYKYNPVEVEVSPVYSKSELIKKAGVNTGIGMGIVFLVLIFISFVISLLKYLPMLFDKDIRKENAKKKQAQENAKKKTEDLIIASRGAKAADTKAATADSEDLMNDSELVAVITAAIYAATASGTAGAVRGPAYTASNDKLVVRSIRRAKR